MSVKINSMTETRLMEAMEYCEREDKSTAFMIQYMMDYSGATRKDVMEFLAKEYIGFVEFIYGDYKDE